MDKIQQSLRNELVIKDKNQLKKNILPGDIDG